MSAEEVRARLAKHLKRGGIPGPVWNNLLRRRIVDDHLKGEYGWEDLIVEVKEQLTTHKEIIEEARVSGSRQPKARSQSSRIVEPPLDAYEKGRAKALGEYVALRGSLDPHVRYFRKLVLNGELLSPEQAHAFAHSAANQCFSVGWFVGLGIPMREHHSYAYHDGWGVDETGEDCRFDDVYIEPPGESFRNITYDPLDYGHRDSLSFPHGGDFVHEVNKIPVEVGSVLDMLRRVSRYLVEDRGGGWNEAQAAWFVLTGEALPVVALSGRIETFYGDELSHGTITIKVEPWVPAETVDRYYRQMQKEMLGHKDNRQLLERSLALFRFVVEQFRGAVPELEKPDLEALLRDDGKADVGPSKEELRRPELVRRPSWRTLQQRWNRSCANPNWRYNDVRNFRRAYKNASATMLKPQYGDPAYLPFYRNHLLP